MTDHLDTRMRLHALQYDIVFESADQNLLLINDILNRVDVSPGDLIVMPEMALTGFSMNIPKVLAQAEFIKQSISGIASSMNCNVIYGLADHQNLAESGHLNQACNHAVCLNTQGKMIGDYQKIHPFTFAKEQEHFTAGLQPKTWTIGRWSIRPFICYDLRFPEAFRALPDQKVDLIVVIANFPASRRSHWLALLQARAIESQSYVLGVNRIGKDPNASYSGDTCLFNYDGVLVRSLESNQDILSSTLELDLMYQHRKQFPFLNDQVYRDIKR